MKKRWKRRLQVVTAGLLALLFLFVLNGAFLASGEAGLDGTVNATTELPRKSTVEIRVMAFNIAKCFVMTGAVSFASEDVIEDRLDRIGSIIRTHNPDVVCLSETMTESGFCDVNQVVSLAEKSGLKHWAFGENYNFGLPFLRVVGGNAVLSRYPVNSIENVSLAGRQPFYVTKNNRRALLAGVACPEGTLRVWSVHNDSFDMQNNLKQTTQILKHRDTPGSVIAGDFNAPPGSASIQALLDTQQFTGAVDGPATFPANRPDRRIDFIFGPANWKVVEHQVILNDASDHCAVLTVFRK